MKKRIIVASLLGALFSIQAMALPKTTIMREYFSTADKTELVGFYYQGCTASAHLSWGIRTNFITLNDGLPATNCSGLGDTSASGSAMCIIQDIYESTSSTGANGVPREVYQSIAQHCR